jgi:hypothetical protein
MCITSYHLDDIAQLWFTQLQDDDGTLTWGASRTSWTCGSDPPPLRPNVRARRVSAHQDGGGVLQPFLGSPTARGSPRGGPPRPTLHRGLLLPISNAVRIHNPVTLAAAMSLAHQVEMMEGERLPPHPPSGAPARSPSGASTTTCTTGATTDPAAASTSGGLSAGPRRGNTAAPLSRRNGGTKPPKLVLQLQLVITGSASAFSSSMASRSTTS